MNPVLEGLEVVYPRINGSRIDIKIESNKDHIIILRRIAIKCKYSTQYMTHRRRFTIQEMMGLAKESNEKKPFANLEAYFKIYNTNQGTVFYFNNPSGNQTVTAEFNLTTSNLELQDSIEKDRFRIVLAP